jgi:N-methylhydantoinase A
MERALDLRYVGQSHELTVSMQSGQVREADLAALVGRFRDEHMRVFGYASDGAVQVVTYRLSAYSPVAGAPGENAAPTAGRNPVKGTRRVHFQESGGFIDCPIYDRSLLAPEQEIRGPAIVEQMDTTTVVLPGQRASVRPASGSLLLTFV